MTLHAEEAKASRPLLIALAGMLALAAAMGIGRFVYTPILPLMEEGLGLMKDEAGLIASANYLGYLLGALGAAKALLPGSQRSWFFGGLAVSALTTAAMGLADGLAAFLLLRFLGGLASAFVLVFASALILERLTAAGRPGLSAVHFGGVGLGIALSAFLVAGMDAQGFSWRSLWWASGALSFLAFLFCWRAVPPAPNPPQPPPSPGGGGLNRPLALLVLAYGLFGFGYVITATFLSALAREQEALSSSAFLLWAAVGLAGAPSVALWGWAGRRLGNDRAFALACLVEAAGVALSVLTQNIVLVFLSAALLGGTFIGITALGLVQARQLSMGDPRRSLALMTAAFSLGQMIGPGFAGYAYGWWGGFTFPSLVAALFLLLAAWLARLSGRLKA